MASGKILVVDDDQNICELLRLYIEKEGFDVVIANDGRKALETVSYTHLDVYKRQHLSMDDRLCIANMAIEAGAKNGIFPVDGVTLEYCEGRFQREPVVFSADADAEYDSTVTIDLSALRPTVAFPHLPENTKTVDERCV